MNADLHRQRADVRLKCLTAEIGGEVHGRPSWSGIPYCLTSIDRLRASDSRDTVSRLVSLRRAFPKIYQLDNRRPPICITHESCAKLVSRPSGCRSPSHTEISSWWPWGRRTTRERTTRGRLTKRGVSRPRPLGTEGAVPDGRWAHNVLGAKRSSPHAQSCPPAGRLTKHPHGCIAPMNDMGVGRMDQDVAVPNYI